MKLSDAIAKGAVDHPQIKEVFQDEDQESNITLFALGVACYGTTWTESELLVYLNDEFGYTFEQIDTFLKKYDL